MELLTEIVNSHTWEVSVHSKQEGSITVSED